MKLHGSKRKRISVRSILLACTICTGLGILLLCSRSVDPSEEDANFSVEPDSDYGERGVVVGSEVDGDGAGGPEVDGEGAGAKNVKACATVEEMGEVFRGGFARESLRVRGLIEAHFAQNGAARIRDLPPEQFCRHGFVMGKASEAGFGNEMYKVLTAAALSMMLNRSLIIGQTRHIGSFLVLSSLVLKV